MIVKFTFFFVFICILKFYFILLTNTYIVIFDSRIYCPFFLFIFLVQIGFFVHSVSYYSIFIVKKKKILPYLYILISLQIYLYALCFLPFQLFFFTTTTNFFYYHFEGGREAFIILEIYFHTLGTVELIFYAESFVG